MVNGKLGLLLAIGLVIMLPLERWLGPLGMGAVDLFVVLLMLTAWPLLWRRRAPVHIPLALAMWLIVVGGLIGVLSGLNWVAGLTALLQELYLFIAFLTVVNTFVDRAAFLTFRKAWVAVAVVESVLLLIGRLGIGPAFLRSVSYRSTDVSGIGRSLGTFQNANAAGGYMLVSLFLLLATPYPRNLLARIGLTVLLALVIVATGSNSALLGMFLGMAVAVPYWLSRRGRAMSFALGLVSLAAGVLILTLFFWPDLLSFFVPVGRESPLFAYSRVEDKLDKRTDIWMSAAAVFQNYPLGIGPNVSKEAIGIGLHNDYVAFMVERGLLGFIGLILLIGEMLLWLVLARKNGVTRQHHFTTGALLGGLVSVLAVAATHEVTHSRPVWLLFAVNFLHCRLLQPGTGQVTSRPADTTSVSLEEVE